MDATARNSLVLLAAVAMGAALFWLRDIFTPLALAIFLMFMIDGLSRTVKSRLKFLPEGLALPVSILLTVLAFLGSIWLIFSGLRDFVAQFDAFTLRVDAILVQAAEAFDISPVPTVKDLLGQFDPKTLLNANSLTTASKVAQGVTGVGGFAFFVLVYLGFLIASRDGVRRKVVVLFPEREDRREAVHVFDRVRDGVEGYIWVQTVTGLIIAFVCWAVMAAVGLDNALFWAFLIFLLSYIPIIGSVIAALAPPLFALVQFETYWQAVTIFVVTQLVLQIVGNVILPKMQADDQNIDPVVVLLSLAFWGAIWGVTGAFLSTPLTVMVMAILAEFKGSRWIAVLLSGDGDPYPDDDEPPPNHAPKPKSKPKPPARKPAAKLARA